MLCNVWYLVLWNWILVWWWALNSLDRKTLQSAVCETHYRGDLKPAVTLQVRSQTPGSRWAGAGLRLQTLWYPHSAARTRTGKRPCPQHTYSHPLITFSVMGPLTSISLSNMCASGKKEMRQSSWLGKITFCKKETIRWQSHEYCCKRRNVLFLIFYFFIF